MPGVSRSGISISAGLFAGLDREAAARFAFLMATPITAGAGLWELRKIVAGEAGVDLPLVPLARRHGRPRCSPGLLAIAVLLRYLRSHGVGIFVAYRLALAALVVVAWLGLWDRLTAMPVTAVEVMKQLRQRAIRDLVEQRPIRTQQELAAALRERGFRATQATISRDVAELGLGKGEPRGPRRLRPAAAPPRRRGLRRGPAPAPARGRAGRVPRRGPAARHQDPPGQRPRRRGGARPDPLAGDHRLHRRRRHGLRRDRRPELAPPPPRTA